MIKQNLHTHTTYCDGKNTVDEMVHSAISKQFTSLGFSSHSCLDLENESWGMSLENIPNYIQDVLNAKETYKDQINIYLGLEHDLQSKLPSNIEIFDYIIGSVHLVYVDGSYMGVDESKEKTDSILTHFSDFIEFSKAYYDEVKKLGDIKEVDIIGHIDLLTKFNEDEHYISFEHPEYLKIAYECVDSLIEKNKIFEVNTGAISRNTRKTPYPQKNLLKYIYQKGGTICLNSDCHNKDYLDCFYSEALDLIQECGFTSMMVLTPEGFVSKSIKEFI